MSSFASSAFNRLWVGCVLVHAQIRSDRGWETPVTGGGTRTLAWESGLFEFFPTSTIMGLVLFF